MKYPWIKNSKLMTQKLRLESAVTKGIDGLCSKTIADCVEALIGAYYVGGGLTAALHVMQWLGMNVGHDSPLVHEAITRTLLRSNVPKAYYINSLELKFGYEFSTKGLLLEAMTHPSQQELEPGICYCYQVSIWKIVMRFFLFHPFSLPINFQHVFLAFR